MEIQQRMIFGNSSVSSSCFTTLPDGLWRAIQLQLEPNTTEVPEVWDGTRFRVFIQTLEAEPVIIWKDLSKICQIEQIFLFALASLITMVTVLGNAFILVVILFTGLIHKDTFLIRTALAVCDLLQGIMPAALAVFHHAELMNGTVTLGDLFTNAVAFGVGHEDLQFHHLRFEREGYALVCSIILSMTTSFSLFVLAIMSIERLCVVTGTTLRRCYIIMALVISFLLSMCISLLLNWCDRHRNFAGYFDPITQLTLGVGATRLTTADWRFCVSITVWVLTGMTVVMSTIATLLQLHRHEHQARENLTIHSTVRFSEMRRLTETLTYMVVLFMLSCIPCIVDITAELRITCPVGHHLAWWAFMAGSSWNWALYTLRGEKFWKHARTLFQGQPSPKDVPVILKRKISYIILRAPRTVGLIKPTAEKY